MGYNVAHTEVVYMKENSVVRARINGHIKEEAAAVLATMGLTVSDAFRLMMIKIVQEKALPFNPLIPNAETIKAMKEARRAKLKVAKSIPALFEALNSASDDV